MKNQPSIAARLVRIVKEPFLFRLALLGYLITRAAGLAYYPLAFTADEAASTVLGSGLLHAWRDAPPFSIPSAIFFHNEGFTLGTSVYLQALVDLVLGRSVWAARGLTVLAGTAGALAMGRFARRGLGAPAWLPPLILGSSAGWFALSRSAETPVLLCALLAGALEAYRTFHEEDSPGALHLALAFAGLAFYTAPAGRWIVPAALLLAVFDRKIRNLTLAEKLKTAAVLFALALPLVIFLAQFPQAGLADWLVPGAGWAAPGLQPAQRLAAARDTWTGAIDPGYWFMPHAQDSPRFTVPGRAYLSPLLAPFILAGLWQLASRGRPPAALLTLAALVLSSLAALSEAPRLQARLPVLLALSLPAAMGISTALSWLERRIFTHWPILAAFAVLSVFTAALPLVTLTSASQWSTRFGKGSLDYGAAQLFPEVQDYQAHHHGTEAAISTGWAENEDMLRRFFAPELSPVGAFPLSGFLHSREEHMDKFLFVMTPSDFAAARASGRFNPPQVIQIVNYPDGSPAFYFIRLEYSPGFDALLTADAADAFEQSAATIDFGGETIEVRHSPLESGEPPALFDGSDADGLCAKGGSPLVVEISFSEPCKLAGVSAAIGAAPARLHVMNNEVANHWETEVNVPIGLKPRTVHTELTATGLVSRLRIELSDLSAPPPAVFCLYELELVRAPQ